MEMKYYVWVDITAMLLQQQMFLVTDPSEKFTLIYKQQNDNYYCVLRAAL
jgi:hypothetical protein